MGSAWSTRGPPRVLGSLGLMAATTTDAVLAKRARITELVQVGKRVGYGLFLLAIVLFFVGFFTTFKSWMVTVTRMVCSPGGNSSSV